MKAPINTSKLPAELHLLNAMAVGSSNSIEASEAQGQRELVRSQSLPTDGLDEIFKAVIEDNGGKIGGAIKDDPIFTEVTLPQGWKKQASDHSMHSDLLDEKGRVRASIFYKAAFYDRSAHIRLTQRFSVDGYSFREEGRARAHVVDTCKQVDFTSKVYSESDFDNRWEARDAAEAEVLTYLDEKYPDWANRTKYWE